MKEHEIRSFTALGTVSRNDTSVQAVIEGSYLLHEAEPTELIISPDMESISSDTLHLLAGESPDERWKLELSGRMTNGKQVWSPTIQVVGHSHHRERGGPDVEQIEWEATADFFAEGDLDRLDVSDGDLSIILTTNPHLLIPWGDPWLEPDTPESVSKRTLAWSTPFGAAEYMTGYSHLSAPRLGRNPTQYKVLEYFVRIAPQIVGSISPKSMLIDLREMFEAPFTLISLISRKRVDWYKAELLFLPESSSPFRSPYQTKVHRRVWLGRVIRDIPIHLEPFPILAFDQLRDGLFEQMLAAYENSPYQQVFRSALIHLLVSYEDAYIEAKYMSIYTALETLVSFFGEEHNVQSVFDEQEFGRLRKKLKTFIREEALPGSDNREKRQSIYSKLLELRRRSFLEQLLELANKYGLRLDRLWPLEQDYQVQLRSMVKRRNDYIHRGKMDNLTVYVEDTKRIQNIVELWLLSLLDVPLDAVDSSAIRLYTETAKNQGLPLGE